MQPCSTAICCRLLFPDAAAKRAADSAAGDLGPRDADRDDVEDPVGAEPETEEDELTKDLAGMMGATFVLSLLYFCLIYGALSLLVRFGLISDIGGRRNDRRNGE